MSTPSRIDAHVRLDTHPRHPSAVVATVTGTDRHIAHAHLTVRGFDPVTEHTLVMARIDREEPYWAERAAQDLTALHITVAITPGLREAIDDDWTWPNYPLPWLTRQEIRQVSDEAQKIYDDIRRGRLVIRAHALDGDTIVAVGSYRDGNSLILEGENHLRTVIRRYETTNEAIAVFQDLYGKAVRPGPAPATDVERQAEEARSPLHSPGLTGTEPAAGRTESVPVYRADPADHDAVLDAFASEHDEWHKWRTWSDASTHLIHESQTLRAELVHQADPRETAWTFAAYETPVSERMWHLTLTGAAPGPLLQTILISLAHGDAWETAVGSPVTEKTILTATRPLAEVGWKHTADGRYLRWETAQNDAGVQFDAFAANYPRSTSAAWTLCAGPSIDRPTWAIHASPHTPAPLLTALTEDLAHATGTRTTPTAHPTHTQHKPTLPGLPPATTPRPAGRQR
ncbi:DUF317 domain-containing protein [Streptomyces fumanus]|uniref:DUF317 domain-containing protein n=1 Tax=Streptomyces fumanus TaxID=67302 RepID=A0A919E0N6_9ACTN|nr:DUF317 domain-containing protein [Streptomyces fumanus]GHE99590.1 hypothetical protein GCM10018772_25000 [Streptomyces fumanus]